MSETIEFAPIWPSGPPISVTIHEVRLMDSVIRAMALPPEIVVEKRSTASEVRIILEQRVRFI